MVVLIYAIAGLFIGTDNVSKWKCLERKHYKKILSSKNSITMIPWIEKHLLEIFWLMKLFFFNWFLHSWKNMDLTNERFVGCIDGYNIATFHFN